MVKSCTADDVTSCTSDSVKAVLVRVRHLNCEENDDEGAVLLEGQWGGPCHCQVPGHLEYCQRNRELAEQWHLKVIKHKEMRKNAWP